jgi:hypothetical protein
MRSGGAATVLDHGRRSTRIDQNRLIPISMLVTQAILEAI